MKQKATHNRSNTKGNLFFSLEKTITKSSGINFLYVKDNHLGNVHVVVSDRKLTVDDGVYDINGNQTSTTPYGIIDYYTADVLSATDYGPFGEILPGRSFNSNSYRYGYNKGSEKDDEISGSGNHITTLHRELDTRLGRWWSIDPEEQENPDHSPYCSMGNNPIQNNDPDGDIFGVDNLIGAGFGALLEVGTQITVNVLSGKTGTDIVDLDYADIGIEAGIGFATSGVGNLLKVGKTSLRITNAIKTAEKVVESNKALKTVVKVAKVSGTDVVKAAVDIKKEGVKVVGVNKDIQESTIDIAGSLGGKGLAKAGTSFVNKGLSKAVSTAETKASRAMTGSANQAAHKAEAAAVKSQATGNAKTISAASGVVSGTAAKKAEK
jgi:RHS repeat-associated protein